MLSTCYNDQDKEVLRGLDDVKRESEIKNKTGAESLLEDVKYDGYAPRKVSALLQSVDKTDRKRCLSCASRHNVANGICILCACMVPDCEAVALFHGRCLRHTLLNSGTEPPLTTCSTNCWQCLQTLSKNKTEFEILFPKITRMLVFR
jgi:hypothetical protein